MVQSGSLEGVDVAHLDDLPPRPVFTHLLSLTDQRGVFGSTDGREPRVGAGYSTEEAAGALVVVLREPTPPPGLAAAADTYLSCLERAVGANGAIHTRMSASGAWLDGPAGGHTWGRAVGALGYAVCLGGTASFRDRATRVFLRACNARSKDLRGASLAAIGAAPVAQGHGAARGAACALLADCLQLLPRRAWRGWEWPEARLGSGNAALCDALIVGGAALGRAQTVRQGLTMLTTLLRLETSGRGHLSLTGTLGRGPREAGPLWDQRPLEAATLADACAHAFALTGANLWRRGVERAWAWFLGANDAGVPLYDPTTGATRDALGPFGCLGDFGAEAAVAALSTLQRVREVSAAAR